MPETVNLLINGKEVAVPAGSTLAAALIGLGIQGFRRSSRGEARGPLCGMGICFECRVTIDAEPHQRSCQVPCRAGMDVRTDE